eukprot:CAMPEP_0113901544 /NCGR_PEP_ID=MMETSP0780_2-20120614/21314_1 /TAXON_ID=652834 /ORGANISM="Palpitomonas bilix" /LENGTH=234 /DNA_ID=CAMNT_0000894171 /DNA_START=330 /DNA_END=1034 /DNA_ORIENTATION=+ /assembly_acc=CAM_ASM_000599
MSGAYFERSSNAFFSRLSSVAEFEFMDGTFLKTEPGAKRRSYSWWNTDDGSVYEGVDEAVNRIERYLMHEGPFDGILGFSQGAAVASIIAARASRRDLAGKDQPKVKNLVNFALLFSGFIARDQELQQRYLLRTPIDLRITTSSKEGGSEEALKKKKSVDEVIEQLSTHPPHLIPIPSLHIIAENDSIVAPLASRALSLCFSQAEVVEHSEDHRLPLDSSVISVCEEFISRHRP